MMRILHVTEGGKRAEVVRPAAVRHGEGDRVRQRQLVQVLEHREVDLGEPGDPVAVTLEKDPGPGPLELGDVVVGLCQQLRVLLGGRGRQVGVHLLEPAGVPVLRLVGAAPVEQLRRGELSDAHQQPVPAGRAPIPAVRVLHPDQALADEGLERLEDIEVAAAGALDMSQRGRAGEDAHPLQQEPLVLIEKVVGPGDGGSQRLVAVGHVARPARQHRERVREPFEQRRRGQQPDSCGRQL